MKHRRPLVVIFLFSLVIAGAISILKITKKVKAATVTFTSFSASSYELSATGVTYTYTFTVPEAIAQTSGTISIELIADRAGTDGAQANFCNATLTSLTDDGVDVSADVRAYTSSPGVCSGQGIVIENLASEIAADSVVVATFADVINPSVEGRYYHSITDDNSNQTDSSSVSKAVFGDPVFKLKVTEPDGTTAVNQATVWMHNNSYNKYAGGQTDVAGNLYLFSDDFSTGSGDSLDDTYTIHVEAPAGSEYTDANIVQDVSIASGSTTDYTADGSGPIKLTTPLIKGVLVVPSGCSSCTASAGDTISDVSIDIRDASFNPNNHATVYVSDSAAGVFRIGGLSGSESGTTYVMEFRNPYNMDNYKGLISPAPIEDFTVFDTNADGVIDYVEYDTDGDGNKETITSSNLPVNLGNYEFRLATKTISGSVVNENSAPMAGVTIMAFKMMQPEMVQTTTDANGEFSMLVGGGSWMFMPEMDMHFNFDNDDSNDVTASWIYCGMGKSANFTDDTSEESSTGNTFRVKTANVTITGTVKTPDGQPLTGGNSNVSIYTKDGCGTNTPVDPIDGTFSANVAPGTYNVMVQTWQDQYAAPAAKTVVAKSGTVSAGVITMQEKNARISGRLWADANGNNQYDAGEGVGNVRVEAFKMAKKFDEHAGGSGGGPMMGGGGDWSSALSSNNTATKGNFELRVTSGTWIVNVMADPGMMGGYSENSVNYIYTGSPIQVALSTDDAQSSGNNFKLSIADATIAGRVVSSETNEGISGIWGFAFAEPSGSYNQGPMMGMGMGGPINNGAFTIKVPAGDYRIGVDFPPETAGYTPANMATVTAVSGQTVTVDVPVTPNNATIRIRFKDTDGNLVTDLAHAEVFMDNGAGGHQWQMFSQADLSTGSIDINTASGTWNIGYYIDPTETNYMSGPTSDNKVTAVANQIVVKDITLQVADSTVSGVVYTPDGEPLSGAYVSVDSRKAASFSPAGGPMLVNGETTGADGSYSLTLPAGTYQVSVFFPPTAIVNGQEVSYLNPAPKEVTISSSSPATANFTFGQSDATITGSITLNGSAQGAFISAYSNNGGYSETTSSNGSYSLNVTSTDTWYVRAFYETGNSVYMSGIQEVVMAGSGSKSQNLVLEQASFTIPDPISTTYNCANAKKITMSNGMEISIPSGAIKPSSVTTCNANDSSSNVTITVSPTAQMSLQDKSIPIGVGYEITAKDGNGAVISDTFSSNVTITIPYSDDEITAALGGTVDESLLGNGYWDTSTSAWRNVSNQVLDTEANQLAISTNHFTLFGVLAAADPSTNSSGSGDSSGTTSSSSAGPNQPMVPKAYGAIVEGAQNRLILILSPNSLQWDANLSMNKISSGFENPTPPLWIASGPYNVSMKAWWNQAKFSQLKNPATLIIRYDPTALGEIPEKSLRLNYYDETAKRWRPLSSVLMPDRNEVAAVINKIHGTYALIGGFGYQSSVDYAEHTVTIESNSNDIGLSEELLPSKQINKQDKHPTANTQADTPALVKPKSWFRRLIEKIISWFQ